MPILTITTADKKQLRWSTAHTQPLLHALFESGVTHGHCLCAGAGVCGKCRVRFVKQAPSVHSDEAKVLGPECLAAGWRLACKHELETDCHVELFTGPVCHSTAAQGKYLAVDIGTTSIKWVVSDTEGNTFEASMVNPLMAVGAEIMSRLRYALSSLEAERHVQTVLLDVVRALIRQSSAEIVGIDGNSCMMAILTGATLEGLAYAPYRLDWHAGEEISLGQKYVTAYVPPLLGPFIGADISAGLGWLSTREPEYPFLLADLGTNGEFVLALSPDRMFACSVPMGPAIEGVGMCCGAMAGARVISDFWLTPQGLQWKAVRPPEGISGTGYVALLAQLRGLGLVDIEGHFCTSSIPLGRKVANRFHDGPWGRSLIIDSGVFVAERDIEELLKAKAAVQCGVEALFAKAAISAGAISRVYLAGALGEHLRSECLFTLGFLPELWRDRLENVGNTALQGTLAALRLPSLRDWMGTLPVRVELVSLVEHPEFMTSYLRAMRFSWS